MLPSSASVAFILYPWIVQNTSVKVAHWIGVVASVGGFIVYSWIQVVLTGFTIGSTPRLSTAVAATNTKSESINSWLSMKVSVNSESSSLNGCQMIAVRAVIAVCETAAGLTCILSSCAAVETVLLHVAGTSPGTCDANRSSKFLVFSRIPWESYTPTEKRKYEMERIKRNKKKTQRLSRIQGYV